MYTIKLIPYNVNNCFTLGFLNILIKDYKFGKLQKLPSKAEVFMKPHPTTIPAAHPILEMCTVTHLHYTAQFMKEPDHPSWTPKVISIYF